LVREGLWRRWVPDVGKYFLRRRANEVLASMSMRGTTSAVG
jgi:hypothetical protein